MLLMRALVASGNTAEALRTYDELRNLLAEELGSAPGGEAQTLHRKSARRQRRRTATAFEAEARHRGGRGRSRPTPRSPAGLPLPTWLVPRRRSPFVGRAAELERLDVPVERDASGGRPQTSSSSAATPASARPGWRPSSPSASTMAGVASSTVGPTSRRALAFQPFVEALRHWVLNSPAAEIERDLGPHAGALASLIPEISVQTSQSASSLSDVGRERLFEAVAGCLAALSARRPLLLVLDDVHWADPAR